MSSLRNVCVDTKVDVYCALVQSVLLYGSEMWTLQTSRNLRHFTYGARDNYSVSAGGTTLLMRRYVNKQKWRQSQNSCRQGVCHYLVISLDLSQLSLHIKPCGCGQTFPQDGIRVPGGRDCQIIPGIHGPLRFRMILECHRALTEMPPFVVVMEEGRYGL